MISWLFIGLVASILFTPGPSNTLLASSGVQIGVRNSLHLIPVESLSYVVAISIWGGFIATVADRFPLLPTLMKLFSAGYMLFLAIKLWRSSNIQINLAQPSIRARELCCATLLNPKALLFASAIFPPTAWLNFSVYSQHLLGFLVIILPIALFWIFIGSILSRNRVSWLNQCNLQRSASIVLMSFCIPLSYSAISSF